MLEDGKDLLGYIIHNFTADPVIIARYSIVSVLGKRDSLDKFYLISYDNV